MRARTLILATALALLLTACGQRGPLFLPGKEKTEAPPAKPEAGQEPAAPTGDAATPETQKTPPEATPPHSDDNPDENPDDKTARKPPSDKPTTPR